jgi:hypothetical protein
MLGMGGVPLTSMAGALQCGIANCDLRFGEDEGEYGHEELQRRDRIRLFFHVSPSRGRGPAHLILQRWILCCRHGRTVYGTRTCRSEDGVTAMVAE